MHLLDTLDASCVVCVVQLQHGREHESLEHRAVARQTVLHLPSAAVRERERERSRWTHTGGGNALNTRVELDGLAGEDGPVAQHLWGTTGCSSSPEQQPNFFVRPSASRREHYRPTQKTWV